MAKMATSVVLKGKAVDRRSMVCSQLETGRAFHHATQQQKPQIRGVSVVSRNLGGELMNTQPQQQQKHNPQPTTFWTAKQEIATMQSHLPGGVCWGMWSVRCGYTTHRGRATARLVWQERPEHSLAGAERATAGAERATAEATAGAERATAGAGRCDVAR